MIYIMAHNKVNLNNFYLDKTFDKDMYEFFLTKGKAKNPPTELIKKITHEGFNVNLEWEFDRYNSSLQNQNFHAPSIFYHTYINNFEIKDDYIGFLLY